MSAPNGDYVRIPLSGSFDDQVNSELHGTLEHETNVESQPAESITSPLTFKFYQHYFDVDTSQVVHRLASALLPNPRTNFIQHSLKPHADLYGPFWIATTLILAAAIGGNVSNYLQSRGAVSSWHYDFQKVTLTSTIIYVYWWLMPLILHAFIHFHRKNKKPQSNDSESDLTDLLDRSDTDSSSYRNKKHSNNFLDVLSTYGYSLAVFVPVSILWTIQISILQWLLFLLAVVVSGAFLIFTLMPSIRKEHPKLATPIIIVMIVLHFGFSLALMIAFFHGSPPPVQQPLTDFANIHEQHAIENAKQFSNVTRLVVDKLKHQ
uniref:Protein YIPF n=1 Tax=Schistosoma japonicum TaxID=6182 RepID=Q5DCV9_SCHJA|nr:SJCHGC02297 protein [Schistosoma japonicum]